MNTAHQSAVAHLKERMTAHPRAVLVAVEIEHLKQLDSLITELEAHSKALDKVGFYFAGDEKYDHVSKFVLNALKPATTKGAV